MLLSASSKTNWFDPLTNIVNAFDYCGTPVILNTLLSSFKKTVSTNSALPNFSGVN